MLISVRCFTCGKVLADKYDWYIKEVEKQKSELSKDPNTVYFDTIKTGPILDKLGLTRYCCRRHMIATVDMMDTI